MIVNYFPSPKQVVVYQQSQQAAPQHQGVVQQSHYTSREWDRAKARGLTITEYRRRVEIVFAQLKGEFISAGDTVYPVQTKAFKQYGKCSIRNVCRHYDDYGDVEWNDPPFLLQIVSLDHPQETINCSVGYVQKREPITI